MTRGRATRSLLVEVSDGLVRAAVPYDEGWIAGAKRIPGHKWVAATQRWTFPVESGPAVARLLVAAFGDAGAVAWNEARRTVAPTASLPPVGAVPMPPRAGNRDEAADGWGAAVARLHRAPESLSDDALAELRAMLDDWTTRADCEHRRRSGADDLLAALDAIAGGK